MPDSLEVTDLTIAVVGAGDVVTIRVSGEVDLANADQFSAAGLEALDRLPRQVVIDLCGVGFMDSVGLGRLVALLRAARPIPVRLLVAHPLVVWLFQDAGLMRAFDVRCIDSAATGLRR